MNKAHDMVFYLVLVFVCFSFRYSLSDVEKEAKADNACNT